MHELPSCSTNALLTEGHPRLAIAIFVRPPVPGQVKTRLAAALGANGACTLYRAFVRDTLNKVQALPDIEPALFVAGSSADAALLNLLRPYRLPLIEQSGACLGARMEHALRWGLQRAPLAVVLGTDIPTLPVSFLAQARVCLVHHDTVLGPTSDGGYYLVGARTPAVPPLAGEIRYSSPHALADTRRACTGAGLQYAQLPPWYDVDREEDLHLLQTELSLDERRAPLTASYLRTRHRNMRISQTNAMPRGL